MKNMKFRTMVMMLLACVVSISFAPNVNAKSFSDPDVYNVLSVDVPVATTVHGIVNHSPAVTPCIVDASSVADYNAPEAVTCNYGAGFDDGLNVGQLASDKQYLHEAKGNTIKEGEYVYQRSMAGYRSMVNAYTIRTSASRSYTEERSTARQKQATSTTPKFNKANRSCCSGRSISLQENYSKKLPSSKRQALASHWRM